jgi:hypothetical protein
VTLDELTALVAELRRQTVDTARAMFYGMAQYRDADAVEFVSRFLPVLRAGQRTMAQLVAAYLAYSAAESLPVSTTNRPGALILPPGIPDADVLDRDGVDMWEVYQRPFRTVWTVLSEDRPMTDAVEAGGVRVAEMTEMDLQQAESKAFRSGMERLPEQVRPRYWRRVLEGPESCAMCVLASTQRYSRGDLKAVHPGCDCKVEPIYPGEGDPFAARDDELVRRAHAAAAELTGGADAGGRRVDYRTITTSITARHGEHEAPLLVRPLDRFTDPGDLPGDDAARVSATDRR